jgi:hypothetical protein
MTRAEAEEWARSLAGEAIYDDKTREWSVEVEEGSLFTVEQCRLLESDLYPDLYY